MKQHDTIKAVLFCYYLGSLRIHSDEHLTECLTGSFIKLRFDNQLYSTDGWFYPNHDEWSQVIKLIIR
ncbi:hypothetical protein [Vibrio natriegens]|uniref:hypothetical protein n=1 Tax=Vibrio natriegens TaxID=691 RepID=UPI002E3578D5|nr:hypothetical protein [Vibrio natriegens]